MERACRRCKRITEGKRCPVCGSEDLTMNFKGKLIVLNVEKSEMAKLAGIAEEGIYALRVR